MREHIIAVYISEHGADKFTILLNPKIYPHSAGYYPCLSLSLDCDSPQGVSQFSECTLGPQLGREISFDQLPEHVQAHVKKRLAD